MVAMDEEQLRTLFSSLTLLAQQGPIPGRLRERERERKREREREKERKK